MQHDWGLPVQKLDTCTGEDEVKTQGEKGQQSPPPCPPPCPLGTNPAGTSILVSNIQNWKTSHLRISV